MTGLMSAIALAGFCGWLTLGCSADRPPIAVVTPTYTAPAVHGSQMAFDNLWQGTGTTQARVAQLPTFPDSPAVD